MLSSVLKSKRAIQVNIQIIITFTKLRELLATYLEKKTQVFKANIIAFGGFLIKEGKPLNPMELFPQVFNFTYLVGKKLAILAIKDIS